MKAGSSESAHCPDCGTALPSGGALEGLCPQCLFSLALQDSDLGRGLDDQPTLDGSGRILGERYQMRELLGRGGIGEVWRAFDLKLRVDVALKALRPERAESERARELLRQEVRSAREVVSPNVCRIFDLVVEDGQELVSMEYIDGTTLAETLRERGPLQLQEAREMASQFLAGLEAIHQAGLVHRDFKPENVMLTRAGRVVVMDFGLAKGHAEGQAGSISGTPAYMSPEQSRGEAVDARADVFAAGVVLAEMLVVGGEGIRARQELWRGVREVPPRVGDGPWTGVLRQALDPQPKRRYASAHALARALEEVTLRLPGFEEKRPYPGLASFTEADAEYFFGREVEVEAVLKKLKRPRLLALIGPSGAGKSSFLRAGLLPTLPKSWKAVVSTPGSRPFQALARALVPAFAGDTEATEALLRFEEQETAVSMLSRWRQQHDQALVVLDQFEELFTLNPKEVQQAFAQLLGRLVLEADVQVLLSMRDDFLFHCNAHEALAPAFADLTPLGTLSESALRRALVQPALACGYRFEDESLVDEMVREVRQERGALPLLAFAASRLWEKRDRDKGLLTREAYQEIGGVAGALAQHAEATLERIGTQRTGLVRELFRNLVTAQGTRASRDRDELLSVFAAGTTAAAGTAPSRLLDAASTPAPTQAQAGSPAWTRTEAADVLDALIDARLLTEYEQAGDEGARSRQQVEIIHESLLSAWPRLVRWQTQDADGAQLRDQLRQAAQAWQDRGKPDDLLWSGTAYRDFALWRERYPGGLTATEEAFASAMHANATRRRRRRRAAVTAALAVLTVGLGVIGVLWQRSEAARQHAQAEALRAEAGKLIALGERELATYPTGALAYAIKSLELADTEPGRLLALRVLQQAPVARIARVGLGDAAGGWALGLAFSPNGEWVATGGYTKSEVLHRDGQRRLVLGDYASAGQAAFEVAFSPGSDALAANLGGDIRVWSIPEGRVLRRTQVDEGPSSLWLSDEGFLTFTTVNEQQVIRLWPFREGAPRLIGTMDPVEFDVARRMLAFARGRTLWLRSLENWSAAPRLIAEQPSNVEVVALSPGADRLAASDSSGAIRIWATTPGSQPRSVLAGMELSYFIFDPQGRWLAAPGKVEGHPTIRLWDLEAPSEAAPVVLQRGDDATVMNAIRFGPGGGWLATAHANDVALWWLGAARPRVLTGLGGVRDLAFTPDGRALVSASWGGTVRLWPILESAAQPKILLRAQFNAFPTLAIDPRGRYVVVSGAPGRLHLVPLDGRPATQLEGFSSRVGIGAVAFSDDGRLVAAAPYIGPREEKVIRVWNLETGAVQVLGPVPGAGDDFVGGASRFGGSTLSFVGTDRILICVRGTGLVSFDLKSGIASRLADSPKVAMQLNHARTQGVGLALAAGAKNIEDPSSWEPIRFRLDGSAPVPLRYRDGFFSAAFDPSDRLLATSGRDGIVRVGPNSDAEPHWLLGHKGLVRAVAFSPDGKLLASGGDDGTIRLWPVPDMSKPPLHTLPLDTLLAKLRTHTNLRAVPDPAVPSGYKLAPDPFPGWAHPPEW